MKTCFVLIITVLFSLSITASENLPAKQPPSQESSGWAVFAVGVVGGDLTAFDGLTGTPLNSIKTGLNATAIACSQSKGLIAISTAPGDIHIYKNIEFKEVLKFKSPQQLIQAMTFTPNAKKIVTGGDSSGALNVWNVDDGTLYSEISTSQKPKFGVNGIAYHTNEQMAAACQDGSVRVWSSGTGLNQSILKGHTHWVMHVGFLPKSGMLLSASYDKTVRLWELSDTPKTVAVGNAHTKAVRRIAVHPRADFAATVGDDGKAVIWDCRDNKLKQIAEYTIPDDKIRTVSFSPNGRYLVAGSARTGKVTTFDCKTQTLLWQKDLVDQKPDSKRRRITPVIVTTVVVKPQK